MTETTNAWTEMTITPLHEGEINRAAMVMAGAFSIDPIGRYLVSDQRNRLAVMRWFWQEALHRSYPHGYTYTTAPEISGIASWLPPSTPRETLWELWQLIWQGFCCAGWQSTYRLLALSESTERLRDRHCPYPHWFLDGLAVAPETQGRGIGTLLLQPVLEIADREGQACCLWTSTEGAVRFYQRQGFNICEEANFQTKAPPLWLMVRSPRDFKEEKLPNPSSLKCTQ